MIEYICILFSILLTSNTLVADFTVVEKANRLEITENDESVFHYIFNKEVSKNNKKRNHYIHPLYDLEGGILTEDKPWDHRHHRGIFWAWPRLTKDDQALGSPWDLRNFTWELQNYRTRLQQNGQLEITIEVQWLSLKHKRPTIVLTEYTTIRIFPRTEAKRDIDFKIIFQPHFDGIALAGADNDKEYGGFSLRLKSPDDLNFLSPWGEIEPTREPLTLKNWLQFSGSFNNRNLSAVTLFTHPQNPKPNHTWVLRRERSMQNATFPGREPFALMMEEPLILSYRLSIQNQPQERFQLRKAQQQMEKDPWFSGYGAVN